MGQPGGAFPRLDGVPTAHVSALAPDAAAVLARGLGAGPFACVLVFISPTADLPALTLGLAAEFGDGLVLGCTTAGEISDQGYTEGEIVAIGLPTALFAADASYIQLSGPNAPPDAEARLARALDDGFGTLAAGVALGSIAYVRARDSATGSPP